MSKQYHFSTVTVSEKHDGSEGNPFTTLSALKEIVTSPGDTILLERGSVFRGEYIHLKKQ